MSNVTQISSYATYMTTVRSITRNQSVIDDLSTQLSSQKKGVDLTLYGPQTKELLDLRAQQVIRQGFISNIDTASPRLKAYDKVLTRLENIASEMTSNTVLPWGPGPARAGSVVDRDASRMSIGVNADHSQFKVNATYTVAAVPSAEGPEGAFDITITDGLGGSSVRRLTLPKVPPADGWHYSFKMSGGPGDGAVVNLDIKNLTSASTSNFTVSWPDAGTVRDRVDATLREIQTLLNERMGDRYLFSGARLATEPVADLTATKQVTKVTLNGVVGDAGDVYTVTVAGRPFSYRTQGLNGARPEPDMTFIARNLADQINAAEPALPLYATVQNNVLTLTARETGAKFEVGADVRNAIETLNSVSGEAVVQHASTTQPQVNTLKFNGPAVDIGDRFGFKFATGTPGHFDYQEYSVDYQISAANFNDMPGASRMDMVSTRLVEKINQADPPYPFTAYLQGTPGNYSVAVAAREANKPFKLTPHDPNGSVTNSMNVTTLLPGQTSTTFQERVDPPNLPDYDTQFSRDFTNRPQPAAWEKSSLAIEEGRNVTYGVVSTDPAFQTLIRAFRHARAAADNPGDYHLHMAKTKSLLTDAKHMIRELHAKVTVDQSSLDAARQNHEQSQTDIANRLSAIEGIDQNEVAARLRQAMTTQEATYAVAGRTAKLSLVNYLA